MNAREGKALVLNKSGMDNDSYEQQRLLRAERTMCAARYVASAFALVQVLTYYLPHPGNYFRFALGTVVVLFVGNVVVHAVLRAAISFATLKKLSAMSLSLDFFAASALIIVYTFDVDTAIWAVMYILPLGGAIRFQRKGALAVTTAIGIVYLMRETFGSIAYDYEFLPTSITFRVGIAFLIAWVAGSTADSLLRGQREIAAANDDLREMNQAMRDFVSIASHDMRTPLSVVGGLSRYLLDNEDNIDAEQRRELLDSVNRNAHALDRLVNDLLTTSSIDAGTIKYRPREVRLSNEIASVIDELGIQVELHAPEDLVVVADPDHVRRIMQNLLSNASKYGAPPILVTAEEVEDHVVICVSDAGNGVDATFAPKLFDRFSRSLGPETRGKEGTGLGLAIVKGLSQRNGGDVWFETNQPSGAKFCVRIPRHEVEASR